MVGGAKNIYGEQDARDGFRRARRASVDKVKWPTSWKAGLGALLGMPLASQLEGLDLRAFLEKHWPAEWRNHQGWSQPNTLQDGECYRFAILIGAVPASLVAGTKPAAIAGGKIRWNLSGGSIGAEVLVQWVRNGLIPSPQD